MAHRLTREEINARLVRLRNYDRLYPVLKGNYERVQAENKHLLMRIKELEGVVAAQATLIEKLTLRIEELETMLFGRRKKHAKLPVLDDEPGADTPQKRPADRPAACYRRRVPTDEEVTDTIHHALSFCPDCKTKLSDLRVVTRFVEDLLPLKNWYTVLKKVTKHRITTGYCTACKKRAAAMPVSVHTVTLGENVRQLVAFATTILRLSFEQVDALLKGALRLPVSDGEITCMLTKEARALRSAYEQLTERIRSKPGAHYDETGWRLQQERQGNYAWVMTGTESAEAVFLLGRSRGKGNAETLRGTMSDQVGSVTTMAPTRRFSKNTSSVGHTHTGSCGISLSPGRSPNPRDSTVAACFKHLPRSTAMYERWWQQAL